MERFGIAEAARPSLSTWLKLLREWNARIDLTAARNEDELLDLMLADAAMLAETIPRGGSVVDVGSGAGAPGLPLALMRPDLRVTLVEPLVKRVSFLRTVVGTLARTDIQISRAKSNEVKTDAFDVAISRATLGPEAWLPEGLRMAKTAWVLLAQGDPPAGAIAEEKAYVWPLTGASRRAIRYERT